MNGKKIISISIALLIIFSILAGSASASKLEKENQADEECPDEEVVSEEAVEIAPDGSDVLVKKVTIHKKTQEKSSKAIISGGRCYKLMGIKWATLPVNYVINPTNPQGLDETYIVNTLTASSNTWDLATSRALFNAPAIDATAQYGVLDGKNSLVFGENYATPGVIAVTSTWYWTTSRRIAEYDISFETNFIWGNVDTSGASVMDIQNIATHEIGHGIGLSDLYNSCTQVTMYGYSGYGETKKRSLEPGDINGLWKMYGR